MNSIEGSVKSLRDKIEYDLQQGLSYPEIFTKYKSDPNSGEIDKIIKELEDKNLEIGLANKLWGLDFRKTTKSSRWIGGYNTKGDK